MDFNRSLVVIIVIALTLAIIARSEANTLIIHQRVIPNKLNSELLADVAASGADQVPKLIKAGADLNAIDEEGCTPLMAEADVGNTEMVKICLDAGADASLRDSSGLNTLMLAAASGHTQTVKLLIGHGLTSMKKMIRARRL